jgi:hypothetical protein
MKTPSPPTLYYGIECVTCEWRFARTTCQHRKHNLSVTPPNVIRQTLAAARARGVYLPNAALHRFIDFCRACGFHESEHVEGRCLLMAGKLRLPNGLG